MIEWKDIQFALKATIITAIPPPMVSPKAESLISLWLSQREFRLTKDISPRYDEAKKPSAYIQSRFWSRFGPTVAYMTDDPMPERPLSPHRTTNEYLRCCVALQDIETRRHWPYLRSKTFTGTEAGNLIRSITSDTIPRAFINTLIHENIVKKVTIWPYKYYVDGRLHYYSVDKEKLAEHISNRRSDVTELDESG